MSVFDTFAENIGPAAARALVKEGASHYLNLLSERNKYRDILRKVARNLDVPIEVRQMVEATLDQ